MIAFLYAGQGSQTPGMGRDFYDRYPEIRGIFDSDRVGFSISELCFSDNGGERLSRTRYTQSCMAAFAAAVTRLLAQRGITPYAAAGLSLGEYSALHAAGVMDAGTLLELLAFRGRAMEQSAAGLDTRMTAVLGLTDGKVREAAASASAESGGIAVCANFNCPGQVVIGGEAAPVLLAEERCVEMGAKRCIPLNVSGPFHTPLMEKAAELLAAKLSETPLLPMKIPVVFNATADLPDSNDRQSIAALLTAQVKSPVLFSDTLRRLERMGMDTAVEIGPGRALSGFVKKTVPEVRVLTIETAEDFERVASELKGQ